MMIVGEISDAARAKSTFSPATELSATVACEKRDANVSIRVYDEVSGAIGRTTSSLRNFWFLGRVLIRAATAAAMF